MPIYEYQCKSCHHHFDLIQKISEAPATQCPQCSEQALIKLVSAAGFQLKGTGWYATDFKTQSKDSSTKSVATSNESSTPVTTSASETTKGSSD